MSDNHEIAGLGAREPGRSFTNLEYGLLGGLFASIGLILIVALVWFLR